MTTPPEPSKPRSLLLPAAWTVCVFVFLAAFMFCMIFFVPKFEKEALEQKMKLPWTMEMAIGVSRWHVKYWYVVGMVYVPISVGVGALIAGIDPQGKLRTGCWILGFVIVGIPAAAMVSFIAWQILTLG